jgi:hypothetical protein
VIEEKQLIAWSQIPDEECVADDESLKELSIEVLQLREKLAVAVEALLHIANDICVNVKTNKDARKALKKIGEMK